MVERVEFFYDSRDNEHKIRALKWIPEGEIKAVLQLVHGMAEHVERYDEFARWMAEKGFLVVAEDHLGHGKSVKNPDEYGFFCEKDALTIVLRDIHRLKKITQEGNPGKKYFMLGHSMGSLLLRNYIFKYGKGIDGAILTGTASQPSYMTRSGLAILKTMQSVKGSHCRSMAASKLVNGDYNGRIQNPRTPFDWLSHNEENIDKYIEDEMCGYLFTLNGFITMVTAVDRMNDKKLLAAMPKELPVIFMSGAEDPVGNYGEGVKRSYGQFINAGMINTKMKLYPELRHEILNEPCREDIFEDIYSFLTKNI